MEGIPFFRKVFYIPDGAGFLPATVLLLKFLNDGQIARFEQWLFANICIEMYEEQKNICKY